MNVTVKTLAKVGIAVFLLYLCIFYWPSISTFLLGCVAAASPILLGCIFAYILNIIMRVYERIWFPKAKKKWVVKSRRPICIVLSMLSLAAVITIICLIILPQLIDCIELLFTTIPTAINDLVTSLAEWELLSDEALASISQIDWAGTFDSILQKLTSSLGDIVLTVVNVVSSVVGGVITAFLSIIFAVYLLLSKDRMVRHGNYLLNRFLSQKICDRVKYTFKVLNESFRGFIIGQCTEAVILGVLCFIGMLLLQMPYAAMISALIAFTALIPIAGAYVGGAVGAFMICTVSPIKALIFVVFLVILQQLEGNLIYPRVVGSNIGLPAFWVLAAVTIGGGIAGVLGMLVGVPLAAALYRIIHETLRRTDPGLEKMEEEANDAEG